MAFGINITGFNRKTLQDILAEISADFKAQIGEVNDADGSVFSQVVRPMATQLAEAWEALEAVYQSGSINGAEGVSLDNLVGLNFITRLPASKTLVLAAVQGTIGTIIPAGNRASLSESNNLTLFEAVAPVTISASNCVKIKVTVTTGIISTAYTVTLAGVDYPVTSATADPILIAAQLVAVITASLIYQVVDNLDGSFTVQALDQTLLFSALVGANLAISDIANTQSYAAVDTGVIACPTGTLDTIENAVSGFASITNFQDGVLGRDAETDKELRTRRLKILSLAGKSTRAAILAKLLSGEIDGITEAFVYENITDVTDINGRLPHSVECVVEGGDEIEIATAIHNTRGAGIQTYGNVNSFAGVAITDSEGFPQTVHFSRPVPKYAHILATYVLYNEEIFPSDGEAQIKAAILAFGLQSIIGKDFLYQRFIGPVLSIVGVGSVTIGIAVTAAPLDPPTFVSANIAIGESEVLVFDTSRITVTI